jgi:ubiquinone/menaquinone biosynthesis C-methylase UbiE
MYMRAENHILEYLGSTHAAFLHARGEVATGLLLSGINCQPGESVLEIGVGTGATLVKLAAGQPEIRIAGTDASRQMLQKATGRLAFCGLGNRIELVLMDHPDLLPFGDKSFDKVYAESVLAIQEGESLPALLLEIRRVLKPGGKLGLNETVWLPDVSGQEIEKVNAICKERFGIIQSNEKYPYPEDWKQLLLASGFKTVVMQDLSSVAPGKRLPSNWKEALSLLYTGWGKIRTIGRRQRGMDDLAFAKPVMAGWIILTE